MESTTACSKAAGDLTADQIGHPRTAAFIRHMHDVQFSEYFKKLDRHMRCAACAARTESELARLRPGERDQLLHVRRRNAGMNDEQVRHIACVSNRGEIIDNVVRHLIEARID